MSKLSQDDARKFIADVRLKNGGVSDEVKERAEKANLPELLKANSYVRRQLADAIKTVVDNLYSKETRFLYELIQNAEDNSYSTTTSAGIQPFLAFKLYPEQLPPGASPIPSKLVVDSNENGFSEENIKAICSIGNSTKKPGAGYIGEKGIGFKSVFKVARKVHIQSGPFSFAFSYTREEDDDGLGLITPCDEGADEELPVNVRTRMALTLLDPTKFEQRAAELREIPDTFLMFLTQLKTLSIEICEPGKPPTIIRYAKQETIEKKFRTTLLSKTTRKGAEESTSKNRYYTMKHDLHNLPFHQMRVDKEKKSIDRATVILAFPVTETEEPVLEEQYTYAFLPLRQVGFKFLVQADFITQANREDIIDCKRNEAVLTGVANAFVDAVVDLCKHQSLRYQWMRYLPESIPDAFWGKLWAKMHEELNKTPLLEPWSGNGLYMPSKLEKLERSHMTEDGIPLLPDLKEAEIYLSEKYTEADFKTLNRLGTKVLGWGSILSRLKADVKASRSSRWKNMQETADWRTRICQLLSRIYEDDVTECQPILENLALIPLLDGRWVSSASKSNLYFPDNSGIAVPSDLGLNLVDTRAAEHPAWKDLLLCLGVTSCKEGVVINAIRERYKAQAPQTFALQNAVAHAKFLYFFLSKDEMSDEPQIRLVGPRGLLTKLQYLYFEDDTDDYSPSKIFKSDPSYAVHYLHKDYIAAVNPDITRNGFSWLIWLERVLRVRRIPELRLAGEKGLSPGLSPEFKHIVEKKSRRLLGVLKRGWSIYSPQIVDVVKEELETSTVLSENGSKKRLHETFLPFPKLKHITTELYISDSYPFIAMFDPLRVEEYEEWRFAKNLRVGVDDDNLDFYVVALAIFKERHHNPETSKVCEQLTRIYKDIQSRCIGIADLEYVREKFSESFIWIPSSDKTEAAWISSASCVWDAPLWLKSKQRLKLDFYVGLDYFFKGSLQIPDASQSDVVSDLVILKSQSRAKNALKVRPIGSLGGPRVQSPKETPTMRVGAAGGKSKLGPQQLENSTLFRKFGAQEVFEEAMKRYDYLYQDSSSYTRVRGDDEGKKSLRSIFEKECLVYVKKENMWYPPSQCVWIESNVKIPGKVSLADEYSARRSFFINVLSISEPTVEMYIESLKAAAREKGSAKQIKEIMALICGLGIGEVNLSSLLETSFLPVKLASGANSFTSPSPLSRFVIMDNEIHRNAFKGKMTTLDFNLEEIRDIKPLLVAMDLEGRFSSKLIKEVTRVARGSQDYAMTNTLHTKSEAIIRCAVHFASLKSKQEVASLYRKFNHARVYVSDGIELSLELVQDERRFKGAPSKANFHLTDAMGALELYFPKDEVGREVCFESDLPRKLCDFLRIVDPGAIAIIGGVFRKDNLTVVEKILENAGIGNVDIDFLVSGEEPGVSQDKSDSDTVIETINDTSAMAPKSRTLPYYSSHPSRRTVWQHGSAAVEASPDPAIPHQSDQESPKMTQETAYKRILENAVDVARQRVKSGVLESKIFSFGPVATQALPPDVVDEAFLLRTQERNFQLGAAGELYIFEYLKGLNLPEFGLKHWTSGIRNRVKVHPDFHEIEKEPGGTAIGTATADIEYHDRSGKLTQLMIEKGHLAERLWGSEKPFYYIEVKTTTSSDWREPFFMSEAQELHIHNFRIKDGESRRSIYMICRLFNLGKGDMTGLNIYLDPQTKRRNGQLKFSPTWTVRPQYESIPNRTDNATPTARTTRLTPTIDNIFDLPDVEASGPNSMQPRSFNTTLLNNRVRSSSADLSGPSEQGVTRDKEPAGKSLYEAFQESSSNNEPTQLSSGRGFFRSKDGKPIRVNLPSTTDTRSSGSSSLPVRNINPKTTVSSTFGSSAASDASNVSPGIGKSKTPSSDLFGSTAMFSGSELSNPTTPRLNPFGGIATTRSPNKDAPKSFWSENFDSNTGPSTNEPRGLYGSIRRPSSSNNPRDRSRSDTVGAFGKSDVSHGTSLSGSGLFGLGSSKTDVSRGTSPSGSGLFGLDSPSSSTIPKAPTAELFGTPTSSKASKGTPPGETGIFGLAALNSRNETPVFGMLSPPISDKSASRRQSLGDSSVFKFPPSSHTNDSVETPVHSRFASPSSNAGGFRTTTLTGSGLFGSSHSGSGHSGTRNTVQPPVTTKLFEARVVGSENDISPTPCATNPFITKETSSNTGASVPALPGFLFGRSPFRFPSRSSITTKAVPAEDDEGTENEDLEHDNEDEESSKMNNPKRLRAHAPVGTSATSQKSEASKSALPPLFFGRPHPSDSPANTAGLNRAPSPFSMTSSVFNTQSFAQSERPKSASGNFGLGSRTTSSQPPTGFGANLLPPTAPTLSSATVSAGKKPVQNRVNFSGLAPGFPSSRAGGAADGRSVSDSFVPIFKSSTSEKANDLRSEDTEDTEYWPDRSDATRKRSKFSNQSPSPLFNYFSKPRSPQIEEAEDADPVEPSTDDEPEDWQSFAPSSSEDEDDIGKDTVRIDGKLYKVMGRTGKDASEDSLSSGVKGRYPSNEPSGRYLARLEADDNTIEPRG